MHLTAGAGMLTDQARKGKAQGDDVSGFVSPTFGFGHTIGIELGIPFGWYFEDGLTMNGQPPVFPAYFDYEDDREFQILPYVKIASNQQSKNKVAGIIDPSSITFVYSHDFKHWAPYLSLKRWFLYGNPAIDDVPRKISRYQEDNQSIWSFAFGAELNIKFAPAFEIGILRNSYQELIVVRNNQQEIVRLMQGGSRRVLHDFFIGFKITL